MRLEHAIDIAAPVERVWALTAAVEEWPSITPTMTRVKLLAEGPLGVGSRAEVKQPGQPTTTWTVTRFEPNAVFAWQARIVGMHMTATHEIVPTATGCRNILTVDAEGRTASMLGWLMSPLIRRALAKENAGFKAHAEA